MCLVDDEPSENGGAIGFVDDGEPVDPRVPAGAEVAVGDDLVLHRSNVRIGPVSGPHIMW